MKLRQARAWAGFVFTAAFAAALLADVLVPTAQLTQTHLAMFAAVVSALFGVDIAIGRTDQLTAALSGAITGWASASSSETQPEEANDD